MAKSQQKYPTPEDNGDGGGLSYIRAADVGPVGTTATLKFISDPRESTSEYAKQGALDIDVKLPNGDERIWTVKFDKPTYRVLYGKLGDPGKWKGKSAKIEVKHYLANDYIAAI